MLFILRRMIESEGADPSCQAMVIVVLHYHKYAVEQIFCATLYLI